MSDKPKRAEQTVGDYVTIALSPLLIMALVGSLVFFLLNVIYEGDFLGRLEWTLFFFVFGIVLIARISIEQNGTRAGLYGIFLGGVVFLALLAFVEYPPGPLAPFGWAINLAVMALAWWSAHRLTWDCTYIDDKVDASGKGVLEAAGLDETAKGSVASETDESADEEPTPIKGQPSLFAWWDRYRGYQERQSRKPHTPGVWVVYFSLAALPLFGLGQALIPADEEERRRKVFWLMVFYVASGLGLLLTTSYLGLRRYLRQRKLKMPVAMTGTWLALGGGLIVVLMVAGALLPRPYGEYQITDFTPLGSKSRDASEYAIKRDDPGKGQGRASTDPAKDEQKGESGSGTKPDSKDGGQGQSKASGGQSGQGKSGSSQGQGKQGNGPNSKSGKQGGDKSNSQGEQKGQGGERDADKNKDDSQQGDSEDQKKQDDQQNERSGGSSSSKDSSGSKSKSSSRSSGRSSSSNSVTSFMAKLGPVATVLKWVVFTVLALVVIYFLLRSGLQFLANFTDWAKRLLAWWQGLFQRKQAAAVSAEEDAEEEAVTTPVPFASFRNPFLDGRAEQLSPAELARYSFEALQSWAWEHDLARQAGETPIEFAERLAAEIPAFETEVRRLASLYARVAYARGSLTAAALGPLRQFWERLEAVEERPVSA